MHHPTRAAHRAPELHELLSRRGACKAISDGLRISTAAVSQWDYVPAARRADVARILGVPVEVVPIRPARRHSTEA